MILSVNSGRSKDPEKLGSQMEFAPTTLRDLVRCSNHCATGDSIVSKRQVVGILPWEVAWTHLDMP